MINVYQPLHKLIPRNTAEPMGLQWSSLVKLSEYKIVKKQPATYEVLLFSPDNMFDYKHLYKNDDNNNNMMDSFTILYCGATSNLSMRMLHHYKNRHQTFSLKNKPQHTTQDYYFRYIYYDKCNVHCAFFLEFALLQTFDYPCNVLLNKSARNKWQLAREGNSKNQSEQGENFGIYPQFQITPQQYSFFQQLSASTFSCTRLHLKSNVWRSCL